MVNRHDGKGVYTSTKLAWLIAIEYAVVMAAILAGLMIVVGM